MDQPTTPSTPAPSALASRSGWCALMVVATLLFATGCRTNEPTKGPLEPGATPQAPVIAADEQGIPETERFAILRRRLVEPTVPALTTPRRGPAPAPITSVRTIELSALAGGTHHALHVVGDRWFQSLGTSLLVLDARTGQQIASIELAPPGVAGPIVDLHAEDDRVFAILERDAVVEIAVSSAGLLSVRALHLPETLGMLPRRFRVVDGDLWVVGEEGLLRLRDRRFHAFPNGVVTGVAAIDGRLAVAANRRIIWLDERIARHAASTVLALPPESGAAAVIGLQASSAARVTLLDGALDEIDSDLVDGLARNMRIRDGRIWVTTDESIVHWRVESGRLRDRTDIRVLGARDVDAAGPNRLAISGSFGRSLYRIGPERGSPGDEFFMAVREPSRLSRAITDGRRVLAGSREGRWLYLIGSHAERSERVLEAFNPMVEIAATRWGTATISPDRQRVLFADSTQEVGPLGGGLIACLSEIDGELWIGHEYGIDVIGPDSEGNPTTTARTRLDGPVLAIFQKWDGGAVFVAEFGGFGVARLVETPLESLGIAPRYAAQPEPRSGLRGP